MRIIYDPNDEDRHSCKKEIGLDRDDCVEKYETKLKSGMILECSCGKLYYVCEYSTYYLKVREASWGERRRAKKIRVAP